MAVGDTRRELVDNLIHKWTPRTVLLPSAIITLLFVYGFILFTIYLSFTSSTILPILDWVGGKNYQTIFALDHWIIAIKNLGIFGGLYLLLTVLSGLLLAIFVNQYVIGENILRPIYLYPMAISFIVTGTAWKWFLDPGIGLQEIVRKWGWESFVFDWIKNNDFAIYCIVIAAVWQATGFVMTIFLAGLRSVNNATIEAARVDGASSWVMYTRVIIPQLGPSFLSALVILGHLTIKSYDLVVALTGGGPGLATQLPSTFMYSYTFTRARMGVGATSAVLMLVAIAIFIVPYIRREVRGGE